LLMSKLGLKTDSDEAMRLRHGLLGLVATYCSRLIDNQECVYIF